MTETTVAAPPPPRPASSLRRGPRPGPRDATIAAWCAGAVAVVAVAVGLTSWARTRPGFDPYGWLTWGQMTLHGGLDTNAAPSWKPLPYVFTLVDALFGRAEMRLWLVTATAVSLAGMVFAARLAYRLSGAASTRRWAGWVAGAFAGVALLGVHDGSYDYLHYVLSAQSDPMIAALLLAAIDCHLCRRPRAAFVLGVLAALGRPEVWPFLLGYAVWLWRAHRARWLLVAGAVAIVALWFGIPALTSRSWFVAGDNAIGSGRAPGGDRVTTMIHRLLEESPWPIWIAALSTAGLAAWRRDRNRDLDLDRVTLALAAGVVVWEVIEIAFALHGWPGLGRYLFEPSAVVIVLAGAFVGRALAGGLGVGAAGLGLGAKARAGGLGSPAVGRLGSPAVGAVLVAALLAGVVGPELARARSERHDLLGQRARTAEIDALAPTIDRLGGPARIRACGEALVGLQYQTLLAYTIGENVNRVGFKYPQPGHPHNPIILFTPAPSGAGTGWSVRAMRQTRPQCRSLSGGAEARR